MERVILRREYNKYRKAWGFLACFPDDGEVNPGCIAAVPFYFVEDGAMFEAYTEIDLGYFYSKKIIHKDDEDAQKCIDALNKYYNIEFQIVEKITRRK